MFKYRYLICTKPVKNDDKYWTRKIIHYNNQFYKNEDVKYSKKDIFKIIKSINENDYDKINTNLLPK